MSIYMKGFIMSKPISTDEKLKRLTTTIDQVKENHGQNSNLYSVSNGVPGHLFKILNDSGIITKTGKGRNVIWKIPDNINTNDLKNIVEKKWSLPTKYQKKLISSSKKDVTKFLNDQLQKINLPQIPKRIPKWINVYPPHLPVSDVHLIEWIIALLSEVTKKYSKNKEAISLDTLIDIVQCEKAMKEVQKRAEDRMLEVVQNCESKVLEMQETIEQKEKIIVQLQEEINATKSKLRKLIQ